MLFQGIIPEGPHPLDALVLRQAVPVSSSSRSIPLGTPFFSSFFSSTTAGTTGGQDPALVALYAPYCGGISREAWLIRALDLLAGGEIQGERRLQPAGGHPFLLRWTAGQAPQETSACELTFPAMAGVSYSFEIATHQLVRWLMDLLEARASLTLASASGGNGSPEQGPDLPEAFWRWLILGEPPGRPSEDGRPPLAA
jgi:hypothetical protein